MKRRLLPLALLLLLCACAGPEDGESAPAPADSMTAEQAARAVLDSQENAAGLSPLTGEERTAYLTDGCGVEEGLWTEAAVYLASGVDAREILVLRLSQTEDGDEVTEALEAHRQERLGDFYGYAPDQVALLEAAVVTAEGGYAALLVCEEPEAARTALLSAIRGELVPAAQTPAEAASVQDVIPSDVPSPASAPSAAPDVSGFKPFDPPNEHDMTLYDTSGIRAAWETGDESGLGEKDAAILERCQEIFAAVITEGMTDFEKELALHDALLRSVRYDETSFDPATPQGQPDSGNPYGPLVEGYGVCLGYATSLQLLLDLAGVECITVVGASYNSTSDHAWNLVRLEGEWYGVDPTWNDPSAWENLPEEMWDRTHHLHFNVTSDDLRRTNHQWDYLNVPEAAGTRFFWNGEGDLPE